MREASSAQRQNKGCKGLRKGRITTHISHLNQRRLVNAELFEVILRRLDDLLDDRLVDVALVRAVSWVLLPPPPPDTRLKPEDH